MGIKIELDINSNTSVLDSFIFTIEYILLNKTKNIIEKIKANRKTIINTFLCDNPKVTNVIFLTKITTLYIIKTRRKSILIINL